ncbi:14543_t:CDS:2, partial [Racocetra fulgida]
MSQQLPVERGSFQKVDFHNQDLHEDTDKQSSEGKNDELNESEMDNVIVVDSDVHSDKENSSAKEDLLGHPITSKGLMTKPITHVSRRDHEQHPKKRVALTSEAPRQQHSSHRANLGNEGGTHKLPLQAHGDDRQKTRRI